MQFFTIIWMYTITGFIVKYVSVFLHIKDSFHAKICAEIHIF